MILVIGFNGIVADGILKEPPFPESMALVPGVLELLTRIKSCPNHTLGFENGIKQFSLTRDEGIPEIALTSNFARDLVLSPNQEWYSDFFKLVTYEFWSDSATMKGLSKTEPEFFKRVLENLNRTPDELIVVDIENKALVAAEMNKIFNVILFNGTDALEEQLQREYGFEFYDADEP